MAVRRREVSVAFQSDKTAAAYAGLARRVEEYGFDALSVYGDLMFQPPVGPLLVMARATTRIRLGPASLNPYTLHPVEIAGQIALLDALSGGRAYLGLSRGAWLDSLGLSQTKPVTTMREAVAVVRHLLAKERVPFDGTVFQLSAHKVLQYDVTRADIPLMIGTWGPKLAALAGEIADEVKIGGCVNPAMVPVMRERIAVGARRAGRDVNAVGIVLGAVTVVDEDGAAARRRAKEEVARYLPTVAGLDPTFSVDPELLARMETAGRRGDWHAAAALISDDLLRPFAFAGTPAEVIAHAETIFAAGASRIEFGTPHGLSDARGVQLLGETVLPALRI
ncbi:MAG: LLM class flavin-dependent oxidoreductase [Thermomicrobiales bacterium]